CRATCCASCAANRWEPWCTTEAPGPRRRPPRPALLYSPASQIHRDTPMINDIKTDAQTRMGKSIDALKHELTRLRTGRASTALGVGIKVSADGWGMPLNQVAAVALGDSRSIIITPFDKSLVGPVEKAILA